MEIGSIYVAKGAANILVEVTKFNEKTNRVTISYMNSGSGKQSISVESFLMTFERFLIAA